VLELERVAVELRGSGTAAEDAAAAMEKLSA
jgi:hypothetical protein